MFRNKLVIGSPVKTDPVEKARFSAGTRADYGRPELG
jgi:hypothetical protein